MSRFRRAIQNRSSNTRVLAALALLLVLDSGARAQDAPATPPQAAAADVVAVFDSIEAAWLRGDAADLVARFAPGRIRMRLPGTTTAAGHFSHQQCLLILKNLFDSHVLRRFEFSDTQTPEMSPGKAVGVAKVSWRKLGVGRTKEGRMLVVLEHTAQGWAVSEMQALP